MSKPKIDDIVTGFSALRLSLVQDAGTLGAIASSLNQDATRFRRAGEFDIAISCEQRADETEKMGMRLSEALQTIGRLLGDAPPSRTRTGEWRPFAEPEETAESLAETAKLDRGEVAEANAEDKR